MSRSKIRTKLQSFLSETAALMGENEMGPRSKDLGCLQGEEVDMDFEFRSRNAVEREREI